LENPEQAKPENSKICTNTTQKRNGADSASNGDDDDEENTGNGSVNSEGMEATKGNGGDPVPGGNKENEHTNNKESNGNDDENGIRTEIDYGEAITGGRMTGFPKSNLVKNGNRSDAYTSDYSQAPLK
jgi:hypothetical protein